MGTYALRMAAILVGLAAVAAQPSGLAAEECRGDICFESVCYYNPPGLDFDPASDDVRSPAAPNMPITGGA
jgi:hypothetical protein